MALLAALALATPAMPAAAKPQRIVSLYLCADQLILQLVERKRIVSLSHLVSDPATSYMAKHAEGIPVNYGLAEEALALKPDLVLSGPFARRSRLDLLRRLGLNVVEMEVVQTIDGIRRQTLRVAEILGEPERGRRLVAEMDARLARVRAAAGGTRPVAAVHMASGVTIGRGTLAAQILSAAGYRNLARRLSIVGSAYVSMEGLIGANPDLLVVGTAAPQTASLASERMLHPALKAWFPPERRVIMPERLWICGGTFVAEAVELLAAARARLPRRRSR